MVGLEGGVIGNLIPSCFGAPVGNRLVAGEAEVVGWARSDSTVSRPAIGDGGLSSSVVERRRAALPDVSSTYRLRNVCQGCSHS